MLEGPDWVATSTITFRCHEPGASTFVDCDAEVQHATLNGVDLDLGTVAEGRLPLPGLAEHNVLVVSSVQRDTGRGRRDPAQRRPVGQARLRLELVRARRRSSGLGLLRPARPQGPAPVHGERPGRLDRHQQHRARLGQPTGTTTAGSGRSRTRRGCRRTSSWSTPGPFHEIREQRGDHSLGPLLPAVAAPLPGAGRHRAAAADRAGTRLLRRAVRRRRSRRSATTRCSCRTSAAPWRTGAASPGATPSSTGAGRPTASASSSPPCCCTRWRTCGSATW